MVRNNWRRLRAGGEWSGDCRFTRGQLAGLAAPALLTYNYGADLITAPDPNVWEMIVAPGVTVSYNGVMQITRGAIPFA
jgi:hypothetical protein